MTAGSLAPHAWLRALVERSDQHETDEAAIAFLVQHARGAA